MGKSHGARKTPILALALATMLAACQAGTDGSSNPTDQELNSLRLSLRDYNFYVTNDELAQLSRADRAELFATLSRSELDTYHRVRFILSRNGLL